MKKFILFGLLFLVACSSNETSGTTYGFQQVDHEEMERYQPRSYQIKMDESFEMVSRYERESAPHHLYFWHEPSVSSYPFELDTTTEDIEEHIPTIEIHPINKFEYTFSRIREEYMSDLNPPDTEQIEEENRQITEEESDLHVDEMKDSYMETVEGETTVYTSDEYDISPFTYMIESESEKDVIRYYLVGEATDDYIRATLTIPEKKKEELFETMLSSLQTITYNEEEFEEDVVLDEPTRLSYEPAENLKGAYPEVGYSFELPESATFRYSFPVYHTYRYTFDTLYEEFIPKEHFTLRTSELVVKVEKLENARNREQEIRNRPLDDLVAFQYDYPRSITYLHEEDDFDTGVFTTAVRVEFDGYEEYWFLKEVDGHVYEVFFDIAFEAPEYDMLLDDYLNVVRTFEIKTGE